MGWAGSHPCSEEVWLAQKVPAQREALVEMCLALMGMSGKPCLNRMLSLSFGQPCQEHQLSDSCAVSPAGVGAEGQQAQTEPVLEALGHSRENPLVQSCLGTH